MKITTIFTSALLSTLTVFAQLPPEVKEASTKMLEIMENPTRFLDVVDDMSFTNKVLFIGIVDKAARAYPGSEDEVNNRVKTLEKYYYISTNTPYLNVPIVITRNQTMNAMMSELQYTVNGTNILYRQKTDRTNTIYKVNSNYLDFTRDMDSDVVLIFDDHVTIPANWKGVHGHRVDKFVDDKPCEPTPYQGQGF